MGARAGVTRAARATATGAPLPAGFDCPRQAGQGTPAPGLYPAGALVACAFGQMEAETLAALAELGPLRLTPWRRVLIEGAPRLPDLAGLITAADDPLLRVVACIGAPGCAQGRGETRGLARRLAAVVSKGQRLHVSGCAKGCAAPRATDLTLTATAPERYDLIHDGRADAIPDMRGLTPPPSPLTLESPPMPHSYITDGAEIYRQSFATIRAEAALARFTPEEEIVAVRMIHAAGMVGLEEHIRFSEGMAVAARAALEDGAPILCDAYMVSEGITRKRLPRENEVICTLRDPSVPALAAKMSNTRSAAALELWRPHLQGAVVAIGNAPTALFHLLNMLEDPDCPRPAAIIGCPVGFIGAAESKEALMQDLPVPSMIVQGRLGGSAITVAAVNALASRVE